MDMNFPHESLSLNRIGTSELRRVNYSALLALMVDTIETSRDPDGSFCVRASPQDALAQRTRFFGCLNREKPGSERPGGSFDIETAMLIKPMADRVKQYESAVYQSALAYFKGHGALTAHRPQGRSATANSNID